MTRYIHDKWCYLRGWQLTEKLNSIIKTSLLLVSVLLLFSCKEPNSQRTSSNLKTEIKDITCIKKILKKDSVLGEVRNHASKTLSLSETINNYTKGLKALDYTKCSEKFKLAMDEHIAAWLTIKLVTDKYPSIRGELHDTFARLEKSEDSTEFKSLVKQIWDTWEVVEESAK